MADTTEKNVWVNTLVDEELAKKLDIMVKQQGSDRAKFIRWLIEKEWEDRQRTDHSRKNFYKAMNRQKQVRQQAAG